MFRAIRHRISRGINALKKSFLQQEGLPFNDIRIHRISPAGCY